MFCSLKLMKVQDNDNIDSIVIALIKKYVAIKCPSDSEVLNII